MRRVDLVRTVAIGLLLGACRDKDGSTPTDDTGNDPGTSAVTVEVNLSEVVPTVARVRWTTDQPSTGTVSFWEVGGEVLGSRVSSVSATEHEVVLLGLAEGVQAELQVQVNDETGTWTSQVVPFTTGTFDPIVPRPVLSHGTAADSLGGYTLLPMGGLEARWATIVDAHGRLVWAWGGAELDTQRMRLTHDGLGVILADRELGQPGFDLLRVDFDGTEVWRIQVPDGHHDFDLIDDETFLVIAGEPREVTWMGAPHVLIGDKLVEHRIDGSQRVIWNAWDHLTPQDGDPVEPSSEYKGAFTWTHANFIRYDAGTDRIHFILRNLSYITELERSTGAQRWVLSPETGAGDSLYYPHSVWPIEDDLLVFNQRDYIHDACSEAVLLDHDGVSSTVTPTWTYGTETCKSVYYTGNAQPLEEGRALVSFGSSGVLDEVDMGTGALRWRLTSDLATWMLYAERVAALGPLSD